MQKIEFFVDVAFLKESYVLSECAGYQPGQDIS